MGRVVPVEPLRQGTSAQRASDSPVNQGEAVAGEQLDDAGVEAQYKRLIAIETISFSQVALIYERVVRTDSSQLLRRNSLRFRLVLLGPVSVIPKPFNRAYMLVWNS